MISVKNLFIGLGLLLSMSPLSAQTKTHHRRHSTGARHHHADKGGKGFSHRFEGEHKGKHHEEGKDEGLAGLMKEYHGHVKAFFTPLAKAFKDTVGMNSKMQEALEKIMGVQAHHGYEHADQKKGGFFSRHHKKHGKTHKKKHHFGNPFKRHHKLEDDDEEEDDDDDGDE